MTTQEILAWATGVAFLILLLGIAVAIMLRGEEKPVPPQAMLIFRVILALSGAGFAAVLPGFLTIEGTWAKASIRGGGALAAFVVMYFWNPPESVQKRVARPARAVKRSVRGPRIDSKLPRGAKELPDE